LIYYFSKEIQKAQVFGDGVKEGMELTLFKDE
jgi:hypothetical protein